MHSPFKVRLFPVPAYFGARVFFCPCRAFTATSFPLSLFPTFPLSHALSYPLIGTPYLLRLRPHPHHYISPHTGTDIRSVSVAADGCRDGDMLFCAWGPCMYGMWGYAGEYGQEKPECRNVGAPVIILRLNYMSVMPSIRPMAQSGSGTGSRRRDNMRKPVLSPNIGISCWTSC